MQSHSKKGMTLIETLVYIGILTIVLAVMIQSMVSIIKTHRSLKLKQSLEASGTISLERMLREIRGASSASTTSSILDLSGTDEFGVSYTISFATTTTSITISKNGAAAGALTVPGVIPTSLVFRKISNTVSDGVRVELSLVASSTNEVKTLNLYGFAVLRNSY